MIMLSSRGLFQVPQTTGNKTEELYHSIQEVQLSCFEYIEQFYNNYNPIAKNKGCYSKSERKNYFKKSRAHFVSKNI